MTKAKQRAFAAAAKDGGIYVSSTRSMAHEVRLHMARMWRESNDEPWRVGWERAKKDGWRIVRVWVSRA